MSVPHFLLRAIGACNLINYDKSGDDFIPIWKGREEGITKKNGMGLADIYCCTASLDKGNASAAGEIRPEIHLATVCHVTNQGPVLPRGTAIAASAADIRLESDFSLIPFKTD